MSQFIDPFVVFILFLTAAVIGVGYAVDTYGRMPPGFATPAWKALFAPLNVLKRTA